MDGSLLVIAWPGMPPIGLDVALLDRVETRESELVLAIGELEVAMNIADGPDAARELARQLAPYTRDVEIAGQDVYEDAKRRLRVRDRGEEPAETDWGLLIADDAVIVLADSAHVGPSSFPIVELEAKAERGETLTLANGGRVQAAMVLLVIAAEKRPGGRQDYARLEERLARFERQAASD